jgi:hypothetical protein
MVDFLSKVMRSFFVEGNAYYYIREIVIILYSYIFFFISVGHKKDEFFLNRKRVQKLEVKYIICILVSDYLNRYDRYQVYLKAPAFQNRIHIILSNKGKYRTSVL